MPQFFLYDRYANEQKSIQSNLKNINEYLSSAFGGNQKRSILGPSKPTIRECKNDFEKLVNNWDNIEIAKKSLIDKGGKSPFNMSDIINEMNKLDKGNTLNYKFGDVK